LKTSLRRRSVLDISPSIRERNVKRLFMLIAAILAVVAATTAPAGAATSASAAASAFCDDSAFDSLSSLSTTGTARGPVREPVLRNNPVNSDIPGLAPKVPANFGASVPVYFHIIHNGTTGNVSMTTINEQMAAFNMAFAGFFGGSNAKISFTLAAVDRTNNAAWFDAEPGSAEEFALKAALKRGDSSALNVYSTSGAQDALLGWAYYPSITVQQKHAVLDGVVINWGSMPGGPFGTAFSPTRSPTRPATGSAWPTPSRAIATARATASATRRRSSSRRAGAPSTRTHARSRASTRSTTTWTTRSTAATRSSHPTRSAGCSSSGCTGA
jgi:hypothetical protein